MVFLTFRLTALRFHFRAIDGLLFPVGAPGNILRGAFGTIFRKLVCDPLCSDSRTCPTRQQCRYAQVFEPQLSAGPSGLADPPRPFVIRASHLSGKRFISGQSFSIDLHLFRYEAYDDAVAFVKTFSTLAQEGLGPRRARVKLEQVQALERERTPSQNLSGPLAGTLHRQPPSIDLSLNPTPGDVSSIAIEFLTPVQIKQGKSGAAAGHFASVFARARDRVSTLQLLYGGGGFVVDFRGLGERAALVQMRSSHLRWESTTRLSSRTGQRHTLEGFVGHAIYDGDLREFIPWLRAAEWTGIGRHTVWGNGELRLADIPSGFAEE